MVVVFNHFAKAALLESPHHRTARNLILGTTLRRSFRPSDFGGDGRPFTPAIFNRFNDIRLNDIRIGLCNGSVSSAKVISKLASKLTTSVTVKKIAFQSSFRCRHIYELPRHDSRAALHSQPITHNYRHYTTKTDFHTHNFVTHVQRHRDYPRMAPSGAAKFMVLVLAHRLEVLTVTARPNSFAELSSAAATSACWSELR